MFSIGRKLAIGFAATTLMTVGLTGVVYQQTTGAKEAVHTAVYDAAPIAETGRKLKADLNAALSYQRGYMISAAELDIEKKKKAWENIYVHVAKLSESAPGWKPEVTAAFDELASVLTELEAAQLRILDVRHTEADYPERSRYYSKVLPIGDQMVVHLEEMLIEETNVSGGNERKELVWRVAESEAYLLKVREAIAEYLDLGTEKALTHLEHTLDASSASVTKLQKLAGLMTPTQSDHFNAYLSEREQFLAGAIRVVEAKVLPGYCVSETITAEEVTPLAYRAIDLATIIADDQGAALVAAGESAEAKIGMAIMIALAAAGAVVVVSTLIAFILTRAITAGLKKVVAFTERLAARDLSEIEVEVNTKDELSVLADSISKMAGSFREVVADVNGASEEVSAAALQISSSNEQMSETVKRNASEVEQISGAVTEMGASIAEVAQRSDDAARQADESGNTASTGGHIVQETVDGMSSIEHAVRDAATSVEELGRRGEQIGGIIQTINEIAEQTNLLALNAAIEAARAGEHGRGFAVVADEVRKLAERTTVATDEVTQSVRAIQDETVRAVEQMNQGTENVSQGVELATRAGESLREIVTSATSVKTMIESIATAAEEQNAAASEVSRAIEAINAESVQTARGTEQAVEAAGQLATKAEHLRGLVSSFRL
ncbi:MAG: methyl-accepting chemotaxis protein [Planctomycetota bacterium]